MVVAQVFLVVVVVVVVVVRVVVVDSKSKIFKNDQVEPNLVLEGEMKWEPKMELNMLEPKLGSNLGPNSEPNWR